MSKSNALAGLIGSYSESDDSDVENGVSSKVKSPGRNVAPLPPPQEVAVMPDGIQPAPIQHCPWSACYDEGSGFTYYWNQQTNAVTWEPPPEYLLALKIAQHRQHLMTPASGEVSAEEWQLYQQALAEKKTSKSPAIVTTQKVSRSDRMSLDKSVSIRERDRLGNSRKRSHSDDEQVKIELITSYDYNSESDSNDEAQSPVKKPPPTPTPPKAPPKAPKAKNPVKKQKTKATVEYGPSLPPNQNYSMPIGPELPPEFMAVEEKSPEIPTKISSPIENKDDENSLLKQLKDKAKILEKLGGELPSEIQDIIKAETRSGTASPAVKTDENSRDSRTLDTNIDDLLDEIEKKELPKAKSRLKIDMFDNADNVSSNRSSLQGSPAHNGDKTPPLDEIKEMFPISKPMFPSAANITATELIPESVVEKSLEEKKDEPIEGEKKNVYLMDASDSIGVTKKKLRISNSVLPVKKSETPAYTTKYSSHIEGFSTERTGLGFSNNDEGSQSPKPSVAAYGTGLMFTKGETLNEDKKDDDDLDDLTDLVEAKLKYLNQLQGNITVTPVQEMLIQMQTLMSAFRCGALSAAYVQRRARAVSAALAGHERAAAPPGWTLAFSRPHARYRFRREDGLEQWEFPAAAHTDMEICTTPPHPGLDKDESPPLPAAPPTPAPRTPPPPAWADPPPPGVDERPPPAIAPHAVDVALGPVEEARPLTPKLKAKPKESPKQEISVELMSFYNDIAEIEKTTAPTSKSNSPEPTVIKKEKRDNVRDKKRDLERDSLRDLERDKERDTERDKERDKERDRERDKEKDRDTKVKKKSKVKISTSMGMKHKTVSSLVAKWQQVAEEIHSD